jgi:hypothetical protein
MMLQVLLVAISVVTIHVLGCSPDRNASPGSTNEPDSDTDSDTKTSEETNRAADRAALYVIVEDSSYVRDGNWTPPNSRTVDYPTEGIDLGQGWDNLRDTKTYGRCVEFSPEEAGGQLAKIEIKRIFDTDSLRRSLSVTTSASAKANFGVGGGGASVKQSFVKSSAVNSQFLNLLVKGAVQNGVTFATPAKTDRGFIELTPSAKELIGDGDSASARDAFLKHCGDSFVAAIERGAELFALYQFSSKKKADTEERTTSIEASGSYLAFSGSVSTSRTSTLEVLNSNEVSGLRYLHTAHRGLRLPYNEESINNALASLGSAPEAADAQPYRINVVRYDSLPGWPGDQLQSGPATREALVALHHRLTDLAETVRDIEKKPGDYELDFPPDVQSRGSLYKLLTKRIQRYAKFLADCEEDKEADLTEEEREAALKRCSNQPGDVIFSDYPFRALMPLHKTRKIVGVKKEELEKELKALQEQYAKKRVYYGGHGGGGGSALCPDLPEHFQCRAIEKQINEKSQELDLYKLNNDQRELAESRYRYWIEEIAAEREEDRAIGGGLTASELAMYRREIYCQYEIPPDSVRCPEKSLGEMLFEGEVASYSKLEELDITGAALATPLESWNDLETKIATFVDSSIGRVPHHYELVDPVFSTVSGAYRVKGKVQITYLQVANDQTAMLLSAR